MSVDGSFRLELEFRRFLDRCPKLKTVPQFVTLLEKGYKITEKELVHAVGELLLHPNYTIPLLGCFRPIAHKIVDRTVMLLNSVPNLRSDNDNYFDEDAFLREAEQVNSSEIARLIYFYVSKGKGLRLHELACLAFSRALDLIPFLLGSVLNYFKPDLPPFERISRCEAVSKTLATVASQLLNVVRASYLLLTLEPVVFTTMWDWSCFLDFAKQPDDLSLINDDDLRRSITDTRWCSMGILTIVLGLSFKASSNLGLNSDEALQSLLRWKEFCMDVSLEKGGWYLRSSTEERNATAGRQSNLKEGHALKRHRLGLTSLSVHSMMEQAIMPATGGFVLRGPGNPFILTPAMMKSFEMVSLAVSQKWPVLLYGPAGAGKTALINKLAHNHGSRVLSIYMDEQMDGKTLIGSYVCTEQPGEFRWQPGTLSQAVLNGFWVVFEDVDKAPPDILSVLSPLLDGSATFSTGYGEAIRVNEGFRLFSTVTSSNLDITRYTEGKSLLGAVWRKVMTASPNNEDMLNIVLEWYPDLKILATKLIETFERVRRFQFGLISPSSYNDRFTLRDLLKLCKRVSSLGFSFSEDGLSPYACESIFKEAIDVFASFSASGDNRLAIMKEIAKLWSIPAPDLYPVHKPVIQDLHSGFRIGRVNLQRPPMALNPEKKPFVELRCSVHTLERIACSVKFNEPVLMVGETGTGKTTLVQTLARRLGQKLTVLNLSQQSDIADLLGGFRPMDARFVCIPLYQEFETLFTNTFSSKENERFLAYLKKFLHDRNWKMLLSGFQKGVGKMVEIVKSSSPKKRKRPLSEKLLKSWESFSTKLESAHAQVRASDSMVFSFVEGALTTALQNGEWILLDEVNLAPPEILQRVIGVLEDEKGSLCLAERGDIDYIARHPNFRLFACMNPATDAGKRDLPFSVRSRFTEYFVDDVLDDEDLVLFIKQFMEDDPSNGLLIDKIVRFYKAAKLSEERLQDGANQRPHYSLRSLYRALEYFKLAKRQIGFEKSLFDGFCMFFQNSLDESSGKSMNEIICKCLLEGSTPPQLIPKAVYVLDSYVLTESVQKHLANLDRATLIGRYPVLLQGPTSSGKTSLVRFLAGKTGREFVRINNHEHTDLQEYLGSYVTDASGKLLFQEGALVKAVRNGQWIVLDELNLAPSDVLEALNRLLDDNRELFVPELCETIRAHPNFMLFATQNPPVVYGGRKVLSRAFRNRFVEIHVDEIPQEELSTILEKRCEIPGTYARKMVEVMKDLQLHRQSSKIFAGKHGFITPRDLFRWADRFRKCEGKSYEDLARDGYYLMAERLREDAEKYIVKEILERKLRVKLSENDLYKQETYGADIDLGARKNSEDSDNIGKIIWTKSMWRMYYLIKRCYKMREPVLLVGETGGGKTTICQLLSLMLDSTLHILNCHQYTETSDFLGGFYPVRERLKITMDFQSLCNKANDSKAFKHFPADKHMLMDINQASEILDMLSEIIKSSKERFLHPQVPHSQVTMDDIDYLEKIYLDLRQLQQKWRAIFMWQDGPLVEAMKNGDLFLVDEISLADDSVLERLNSVLEPERKLSLAEKGGSELENIKAHPDFFLIATMNPGGDYGKKELSPALRNRFTEIWVPSVNDIDELKRIALGRISDPKLAGVVNIMLNFWEWFNHLETGTLLTIRDLLSWVSFINVAEKSLSAEAAMVHGAYLVLLDGLKLGTTISKNDAAELRAKCLEKLKEYLQSSNSSSLDALGSYDWENPGSFSVPVYADNMECDNLYGIHPFYIEKGTDQICAEGFELRALTTRNNALRVLRAMQLNKPVLLEGSPGVGKTSLIVALGRISGHTVVRINLSEQTDIMDLLGSDLPVESDEGIQFAWSDGILLQALKKGSWVLLDELNLAPQSVLEGLNAILDHRAEVFIPELGRSFKCPTSFRVFACQNPSYQGGGRKGLPKSFLNRFTKVYVDELVDEDYVSISSSLFPSIEVSLLRNLIEFNKRLHQEIMLHQKFGQDGSPWEFNLRDVIRSCQIIKGAPKKSKADCFLNTVYLQRMRTAADRIEVSKLHEQVFGVKPFVNPYPRIQLNPHSLFLGDISIERHRYQSSGKSSSNLKILPDLCHCLEAVGQCVREQWLCILVGPPSSGKTSVIRLLAELTGNVLNELNLSSTTDISELLGCFEQHNASHHYHNAVARVERYVNEYINLQLESFPEAFCRGKDLITQWFTFLSTVNNGPSVASFATYADDPRMRDSMLKLVNIIESLKRHNDEQNFPVSWSSNDLDGILNTIRRLEEDHKKRQYSVRFEWIAGVLIKAIENGEWIVLENANLCNPTVLDRINSLVEQSGSITINECGIVEGKPVVVHPHPNFRMFLTVNPSYGEVSRAMRNRGVEIYVMQPYWLLYCRVENLDELELRDVKRFVVLSGIPLGKLVDMMAKAHVFATHAGSHNNVAITYLELSRWVQLFQQLIMNGNEPAWSLQTSWEHTYLSSFGEEKGKGIVSEGAESYLSMPELCEFTSADRLLCLPGGWPTPLKLRDYVCYSKQACVRRNCMYLESLGSQIASHAFGSNFKRGSKGKTLSAGGLKSIHLVDAVLLQKLIFPKSSDNNFAGYGGPQMESEIVLAQKKLFIAADWVIQQATESDYLLYIQWFEWFGSRLQPFFSFFNWFSDVLKEELQHSIWTRIFRLRSELMSSSIDEDSVLSPLLSLESVDVRPSGGVLDSTRSLLMNSIKCASLLRHSLQQWSNEDGCNYGVETRPFVAILKSLRRIEAKVLDLIVDSPSFPSVFQSYRDLLEHHMLFWKSITSSQNEHRLVFWRSLMKDVMKLKEIFPADVEIFQIEMKNLNDVSSLWRNSRKSLLWKHGGHPSSPTSADVFRKLCQLSNLCDTIWPGRNKCLKIEEYELDEETVDAASSANVELRSLAMEGVCMSSYIVGKGDDTDFEVAQKLEEMYQMLSGRLDFEKHKLEVNLVTSASWSALGSLCCVFTPDVLCRKTGLEFWQLTQTVNDETSLLLDLELLQHLTQITVIDTKEQSYALCNLSSLLRSSLDFSLEYSSRPPTDFLPHQKILWTIDAAASVNRENVKLSSFTLEMWYRWHATLWDAPVHTKQNLAKDERYGVILPPKLFQPLKLAVVNDILESANSIGDYPLHSLKLRAASHNIWYSSVNMINPHGRFLSTLRCLFQQIVLAHKKSFEDSKFADIRSAFHCIQEPSNVKRCMKVLLSLMASSNHHVFASLIDSYIEPLLRELYSEHSPDDIWQSIGRAFLLIGGLRYNLLICCDALDPTAKYSIVFSELTEKIASLEIEIQVHKECDYLVGSTGLREADDDRRNLLKKLNAERNALRRKIVFRSDPGKFKELKHACDEFLEACGEWTKRHIEIGQVTNQVENWQEIASRFIERLANEYPDYIDIVEPVQIAVYEMKLGLSFIVSSALYKSYWANGKCNMDVGTIHELIRFPRGCASESVSLDLIERQPRLLLTCNIKLPTIVDELRDLVQKIVGMTGGNISDAEASTLPIKVTMYHIAVSRIKESFADARFLGNSSFELLRVIFDDVACLWMKHRVKPAEAQQFKFRTRALTIENIVEIDLSDCKILLTDDSYDEWQKLLSEELDEKMRTYESDEFLEQDWKTQESRLNDIVEMHNQLFGSVDLVQRPGSAQVSDKDRFSSFLGSYALGVNLAKDLKGLHSSSLDARVAPEHLLYLCLEHDNKFRHARAPNKYNFYKESNSPMLAQLVGPVSVLKQRVLFLMKERDDDSALQKILEIANMILAFPLDTPLAKALSGLEFLLNSIRIFEENGAKLQLSDLLVPIFGLVSSWHKLEFESWPALLDEVQSHFERNAGNLWFPLYSVFQRDQIADTEQYNKSTIESLEEFFKTSCIGEFRKQLQLLLSFHGYISREWNQRFPESPCESDKVNIIYNTFGFYVQLLPRIVERIKGNRRSIEMELQELLKLCRWDRIEKYYAIENLKKRRLKSRKIVKKYMEMLQQPLLEFLGQEASRIGVSDQSFHGANLAVVPFEVSSYLLKVVNDCAQSKSIEESPVWFDDWWKSIEGVGDVISLIKEFTLSEVPYVSYWHERKQLWQTIISICDLIIRYGELWDDKSKMLGKRRAFSDLLKCLESYGLSKNRTSVKEQFDKSESWILQPSYEMQHLLPSQSDLSSGDVSVGYNNIQSWTDEGMWKMANKFYFMSIASNKCLGKICLNFHKDFDLVQVNRSASFVDHLIEIQQHQRAFAYDFARQLKYLRQCAWPLSNLCSRSTGISGDTREEHYLNDQHTTFKSMWKQKQLFDAFCAMMYEECLLLQTVENNHLNTCSSVKLGVEKIRLVIQNALPDFQKAKNLLDQHLLGSNDDLNMAGIALPPFGVTREMEVLLLHNFDLVRIFEKNLSHFHTQEGDKGAVQYILLGHFDALFARARTAEDFYCSSQKGDGNPKGERINDLVSAFKDTLQGAYKRILEAFKGVRALKIDSDFNEALMNIKDWKILFEREREHLDLELICGDILSTTHAAGELLNYCGCKSSTIQSFVYVQLRHLHVLLDKVLAFGDNLLQDFLVMHRMVSTVTHVLANIFTSLFSNGFGIVADEESNSSRERTQDANGTGMGEGEGLKDVSDQIDDEDQLLGNSERTKEEQDATSDQPSKTEKGVEMEQDFNAEAFSVSEDESGDDENDVGEDGQLESAMGEVGEDGEIADEKLADMGDDNDVEDRSENEKYEQGPSVKDKAGDDKELRPQEKTACANEDVGDLDAKESKKNNDENENEEGDDGAEDMNVDKADTIAEPSGIDLEQQNQTDECTNVDEPETMEPMEDGEPEDLNGSDIENDDGTNLMDDEFLGEDDPEHSAENGEAANNEGILPENDTETDVKVPKNDASQSTPNVVADNVPTAKSAGQPNKEDSDSADLGNFSPDEKYSDFSEFQSDLAPTSDLHNSSQLEVRYADATNGKLLSHEQSKISHPPSESLIQKSRLNPCRSVGDALEGWKERVKVSVDLQDQINGSDDTMDEDADEYGFTAEFKEGTAQALGPATADQVNEDIAQNDVDKDVEKSDRKETATEFDIEKQTSQTGPIRNTALNHVNDARKQSELSKFDEPSEDFMEIDADYNQDLTSLSESVVSVKRSYVSEMHEHSKFMTSDDESVRAGVLKLSAERTDATALWRSYEILTTRLSQELAEQLRLVMEPTLASKLQGDYKTGKRINMKKVIPYIASHYRKDKIWLRRTRPSKRDYQVVIAVDDSRSMSEGRCGNFAIEALVTVCRAMSQLEVGNFAVTSFGQQGNIKLLHGFDQPFSPEAGIKMISSLTFKQENTIADEPMVDLLKYLNNMLDTAVVHARLPSGYNPLQQLVLIIADGRFNEKEKLKQRVRDLLSKKRMVAFLLLDSPNESIMEFMEATVQGKDIKFSKYLDSFPFPFYIVLKNIEALPRTLADLLRQWFELMQYSRE